MLFLIEYDRGREELVTFQAFTDEQQKEANEARLELELRDNRLGLGREIVILGATTEAQIRRTHGRYFETLAQIVARFQEALAVA
jgi:hypothetical protein